MSTTVLSSSAGPRSSGVRLITALLLAIWFVIVISLGAKGAFLGKPGAPPIGMAIGFTAPLLIFFAWLRLSPAFRDFILSLDLRLISGIQAWRFAGLGFLFLYAYKVLPGLFALPAGLGDMAVGLAAPWMILGLVRDQGFATNAAFVRWNWLGVLDLVVALGLGASMAMAPGTISTTPMAALPLLIIPVFLVPIFLMLHAAALMQSRRISHAGAVLHPAELTP